MAEGLERLWARAVDRGYQDGFIRGRIGKRFPDGSVSVDFPDRAGFVYVTLTGEATQTVDVAFNPFAARIPGMPVKLRVVGGILVIKEVDEEGGILESFLGGATGVASPPHVHRTGSGQEQEFESFWIDPGRVLWSGSGMVVRARPLQYRHAGVSAFFPGGTLDLAGDIPTTAGAWRWSLVALTPATGVLVSIAGVEYASLADLTAARITDIDAQGFIPLGAVRIREGDVILSNVSRYADARHWLDDAGEVGGAHDHDGIYSLIGHSHGSTYVHPNHTGDVTSVGDGATTIANNVVTLAKIQQIQTQRLLGRNTAAAGDVEELSALPTDIDALYLLLAGRPANYQIAYGGNASGGNLLLRSTSHSTKGFVIVADDGGNIGLGTASPDTKVHMVDSGLPTRTERLTTFSNSLLASFSLKLTSSNNIVDGFGPVFLFEINDNTLSGLNVIGRLGAIRDGADNSGAVVIHTTDAGTESEKVRVKPDGRLEAKAGRSVGLQTAIGGVMFVSTTAVGNIGTGDDNLITYNVPANTLNTNGDNLWFEAWGTIALNSNVKTLRIKFGGTVIAELDVDDGVSSHWIIRGRVIRTGASAQVGYASIQSTISSGMSGNTGLAASLSSTVTLAVTGEAVSNNDLVCRALVVGFDPANT